MSQSQSGIARDVGAAAPAHHHAPRRDAHAHSAPSHHDQRAARQGDHDHGDHAHLHRTAVHHGHGASRAADPAFSLLRLSFAARAALALMAIGVIWLAVWSVVG